MSFIDHEHPDFLFHFVEDFFSELTFGETLRRNQQQIAFTGPDRLLCIVPLVSIVRVDCDSTEAKICLSIIDLIPHQREQRTDHQGWASTVVAERLRRNEINNTLPPSRPLDNEQPLLVVS
jgi:hypothetical protein